MALVLRFALLNRCYGQRHDDMVNTTELFILPAKYMYICVCVCMFSIVVRKLAYFVCSDIESDFNGPQQQ